MIDDSIISMVAIGLTLLFLGLVNSYKYAETQLPPDALPHINLPLAPTTGSADPQPVIRPGTILTGALAPLRSWVAKLGHEHPLIGRIWATDRQEAVLPADVATEAAQADIVLIGETHDNPDHHNLQAWLIRELARKGRHPGVVMEMIGADKAQTLASYLAASNANADGLGGTLDWDNSGWPAWSMYRPVAEEAMAAGYPILAGDASKSLIQQISEFGIRSLSESEREQLGLSRVLPAKLSDALTSEIKTAHCGQLQDPDVAKMTEVQRFRDATLADNLLKAVQRSGSAILIAGAGHVRTDRGVPYYLHARAPGLKVLAIQLEEVETGVENPEDAVPRDPDGKPAANFVWFTARSERPDACDELRKQLQKRSGTG